MTSENQPTERTLDQQRTKKFQENLVILVQQQLEVQEVRT